jgi:hypothetical protein
LPDLTQPGALPLRPLTTGEVLDSAVVLLRTRTSRLVGLGAIFALTEQAILFPLRRLADVDSSFLPADDRLGPFGVLVVIGFATEAFFIAILGGIAAAEAPRALLGTAAPGGRRSRIGSVTVVGLLAGLVCGATAWTFLVLPVPLEVLGLVLAVLTTIAVWPFGYGLVGLAAPIVVIDELGPMSALGRSVRLASRNVMRAMWIRVLGYVAWLFFRLGLAGAAVAIVSLFYTSPSSTVDNVLMGASWLIVNALAYPVLGCLDVALHLDVRMRTEGLDIALRGCMRRGAATDRALAVPRAVPAGQRAAPVGERAAT